MKTAKFAELLRALAAEEVEAIIVGMLSGVLQGAPLTTGDVDIVHRRTPENVERLLRVLARVNAIYRHDPRRLRPTASHLLGSGHQLLETDFGDLDCLGEIDGGRTFEELERHSSRLALGGDLSILVLNLRELVEVKRRAGRPKDLAVLPVLEATIDEAEKR
jgi:hypothetical protein